MILTIDASLLSRRVFPSLQMVYNSLSISRNSTNKLLTVSFRPNNCTVNLSPITVRQTIANVNIKHLLLYLLCIRGVRLLL